MPAPTACLYFYISACSNLMRSVSLPTVGENLMAEDEGRGNHLGLNKNYEAILPSY